MITLREPTTFDVVRIVEKRKNESLEAREIYAQKPYHDIRAQVETLLLSELSQCSTEQTVITKIRLHAIA
jgi:hypothetical protein